MYSFLYKFSYVGVVADLEEGGIDPEVEEEGEIEAEVEIREEIEVIQETTGSRIEVQ